MHSVPGGPFDEEKAPLPPAAKENILRKYGLDKPLYEQYLLYMGSAVRGDFGISFQSPTETVTQLIARAWPISMQLGGAGASLLAFTVGIPAGILAAVHQNSWLDYVVTFVSTLGSPCPISSSPCGCCCCSPSGWVGCPPAAGQAAATSTGGR